MREIKNAGGAVEIGELLAIIFVLGVPSVILATRLAIRPLIKDIVGIKADAEERARLEGRVARLEDTIRELDTDLNRLLEADRFGVSWSRVRERAMARNRHTTELRAGKSGRG